MRLRALASVAAFALLLPVLAIAQAPANPKVDAIFSEYNANTPGCVLGVVRDGKMVYEKGYGQASIELGVPITAQTVFDIGSTSKQFTATSILLLAQQGKLSLDDDIHKYIPELADYGKRVTLRQMLHHLSGLRDYIGLLTLGGAQGEAVTGDDEALAILAKQRGLNYAPGEDFLYSNSNYFLMSLVVKRVSGKPLREFARDNIFVPLGMNDTQILDDHTKIIPRKAESYEPKRGGGFQIATSNWEQTGDGAIQTTIEDLAKWDQNFYDARVGGEALLRELQTTGVLNNGTKSPYALGLVVNDYRGLRRVSHGGAWAGFRTEMMRFPDQHFTAIVICNVANANPTARAEKVAEAYLGGEMKTQPTSAATASVSAEELQRYAGTYYSPETMSLRRFTLRDGKLYFAGGELLPTGNSEFMGSGGKVRFSEGKARMEPTGTAPESLVRVEDLKLPESALGMYSGTYHSDEIGVTWKIALRGDKLMLVRPQSALRLKDEEQELRPLLPEVFTAGPMVLRFDPGAASFVIGLGRMRGMKFVRQPNSSGSSSASDHQ